MDGGLVSPIIQGKLPLKRYTPMTPASSVKKLELPSEKRIVNIQLGSSADI
jgi:hypothetical protein